MIKPQSSMVARIAELIFNEVYGNRSTLVVKWDDVKNHTIGWDCFIIARKVISAMREPTAKMIAEGEAAQSKSSPIYDYHTDEIWRCMIDEALK